jgi:hypothetical protein
VYQSASSLILGANPISFVGNRAGSASAVYLGDSASTLSIAANNNVSTLCIYLIQIYLISLMTILHIYTTIYIIIWPCS